MPCWDARQVALCLLPGKVGDWDRGSAWGGCSRLPAAPQSPSHHSHMHPSHLSSALTPQPFTGEAVASPTHLSPPCPQPCHFTRIPHPDTTLLLLGSH